MNHAVAHLHKAFQAEAEIRRETGRPLTKTVSALSSGSDEIGYLSFGENNIRSQYLYPEPIGASPSGKGTGFQTRYSQVRVLSPQRVGQFLETT